MFKLFRVALFFVLLVSLSFSVPVVFAAASNPVRVHNGAFPAKIAFLHHNHLWFVDGYQPDAKPVQLTKSGLVQIIGWSPSGEWLAYTFEEQESFENIKELWVTNPVKHRSYLIEKRVNIINAHRSELPAWSPTNDTLAYLTSYRGQKEMELVSEDRTSLTIVRMQKEKPLIKTVLSAKENLEDFTWEPDGNNLTVSYAASEKRPMIVERVTLDGQSSLLFSIEKEGVPGIEGMDQRSVVSMKWSPDGHYLAYFLHPNSGSTSADSNTIEVINMQNKRRIPLGTGLKYAEWFTWSPDSAKLAYIDGEGRDGNSNKRLTLFDVTAGERIVHADQKGQVDTHPAWLPGISSSLLFTRGPATDPLAEKNNGNVFKNRHIWMKPQHGNAKRLTSGPSTVSDYNVVPQINGNGFMFLRLSLDKQAFGSIYYQSLSASKPVEWIRGVDKDFGYYGNFLPPAFAVYQKK
ncbi:hypothetical protein [Aneurinibacillus aneurinilyticus]|uniref:hypothetical protein n=2 Tax=Aneurinibacillus aneurinilyticus TaxID=1391 RepID=UPI003523EAB5